MTIDSWRVSWRDYSWLLVNSGSLQKQQWGTELRPVGELDFQLVRAAGVASSLPNHILWHLNIQNEQHQLVKLQGLDTIQMGPNFRVNRVTGQFKLHFSDWGYACIFVFGRSLSQETHFFGVSVCYYLRGHIWFVCVFQAPLYGGTC